MAESAPGTNPRSASRISGRIFSATKTHTTQDALPFPPKSTPSTTAAEFDLYRSALCQVDRDGEDQRVQNENSWRGVQDRGKPAYASSGDGSALMIQIALEAFFLGASVNSLVKRSLLRRRA